MTYLGVLVLGDLVACPVGAGLAVQQLPVTGAYCLELGVLEKLAVVSLAYNGVDQESYTEQNRHEHGER